MVGFSVIDAALEGIRLTREKPRVVLLWGLYYIAFTLVLFVIAYVTLGVHMSELLTLMRNPPNDQAALQRLAVTVAPFLSVGMLAIVVFLSSLTSAIYRRVLRPDDARAGLRLGMDELRLLGVLSVLFLVVLIAAYGWQWALVLTAGLPIAVTYAVIAMVTVVAIWTLIRLSLMGPASFVRMRITIVESWRLTEGQSWRLFVSYLLAIALAVVVLLLMRFVVGAVFEGVRIATGVSFKGGGPLAMTAFAVLEAILALIATCAYVILQAPPAAAYVALAGEA
jgi:hypothetical protein